MGNRLKVSWRYRCYDAMMSSSNAWAGSTGMPWETGVQSIFDSLTGPLGRVA